jgi:hypothetical protein
VRCVVCAAAVWVILCIWRPLNRPCNRRQPNSPHKFSFKLEHHGHQFHFGFESLDDAKVGEMMAGMAGLF